MKHEVAQILLIDDAQNGILLDRALMTKKWVAVKTTSKFEINSSLGVYCVTPDILQYYNVIVSFCVILDESISLPPKSRNNSWEGKTITCQLT
ncbi:hypothetical protein X798_04327 [Onchocerca flexuosa]|uniref:Uncharacterized protein n=1 Tax=Onchocerca flexuosa TaxID=387005 RepID=A0A238BUR2_9BILA|nr:hypothetical protein X798_04327 [Onchocerca flexuosa]